MLKEASYTLLGLLTVLVLGLSAGAMLGEQQTLVPFWREATSEAFYSWYGSNASRLKGFFGPMQIAGAVLASLMAVMFFVQQRAGRMWMGASACFALAVLAMFFLFFREANAGFVARSFSASQLPVVLKQWSSWQWARIGSGTAAFATALVGLYLATSSGRAEAR